MALTGRIDVHQHIVPQFWVEDLKAHASRHRPPPWSAEGAIAFMDAQKIDAAVLSLTAPAFFGWAPETLRDAARQVNDYTADVVANRPDRFGNFITVPLPDIDATLAEIERGYADLNADGVTLLTHYGDDYLGDPKWEPVWAELNRRKAIVFIHPTRLAQPELPGIPAANVDFPFATTRAAVQMVTNGVIDRYPDMKVILSHGGGFLPYAVYRFSMFAVSGAPGSAESETFAEDCDKVLAQFKSFYLDTTLASSPTALPSLKAFADPTRILFGTDYPYAPGRIAEHFITMLNESDVFSDEEQFAIARGNAQALFGTRWS